jgi:hypothetical protein
MSAIPLTVFLSLALAALFVVLFWREHTRRRLGGPERDSLLPLADETPRAADGGEHDHDDGDCGCRTGLRPPCAGCLKSAPRRG